MAIYVKNTIYLKNFSGNVRDITGLLISLLSPYPYNHS